MMKTQCDPEFMLHFISALHCEAKALITHFHLKKITKINLPFPIFTNASQNIFLIVSGIGKIKIAAATAFLHVLTGTHSAACFLNVGIAGSKHFLLGQTVLVNKIIENSTQRCWYPFTSPIKNKIQSTLITYDLPQKNYPETDIVDMEGSAFFQTATYFVTQEHIQLLKIISDNDTDSQQEISVSIVEQLIEKNLSDIIDISNYLINLSRKEFALKTDSSLIALFQEKWHFTYNQTIKLKEHLRRWNIHGKNQDPLSFCHHEKNATRVIQCLAEKLETIIGH